MALIRHGEKILSMFTSRGPVHWFDAPVFMPGLYDILINGVLQANVAF
jgi:hypothetical protein